MKWYTLSQRSAVKLFQLFTLLTATVDHTAVLWKLAITVEIKV